MNSTTNSTTVQARDIVDTRSSRDYSAESHKGVTLNSSERVTPDEGDEVSAHKPHFIRCTKPITISTLNTRTLNPTGRYEELCYLAKLYNINVICTQDHKSYHPDDDIKHHNKQLDYQLITSSCWKNKVNASVGGVGFLLSRKARDSLTNIEKISDRLIIAEFNSNPV